MLKRIAYWVVGSMVLGGWLLYVWILPVFRGVPTQAGKEPAPAQSNAASTFPLGQPVPSVSLQRPLASSASQSAHRLDYRVGYLPVNWDGSTTDGAGEFHNVAVADVTGDGLDDIIATGNSGDPFAQLYVYPQTPAGGLGVPMRYKLEDGGTAVGLITSDLNGDHVEDVIVTCLDSVVVGLSNGEGMLALSVVATTVPDKKEMGQGVVAMDLNNDGRMDLVGHLQVAYAATYDRSVDRRSRLRIWYGNGNGGISGHQDTAFFGVDPGPPWGINDVQEPSAFITDDFNGDGRPDIALAAMRFVVALQQNPRYVVVYLNNGRGDLLESQAIRSESEYIASIDADGDGRRDVVGVVPYNAPTAEVQIHRQGSDGLLGIGVFRRFPTSHIPIAPRGVDLDMDGDEDLLLAHHGWAGFGYHPRQGEDFDVERGYGLAALGWWQVAGYTGNNGLAVGDLNRDGCKDVAIASRFDGLQVFSGRNCGPPRVMSSPLPARRGIG